MITVLFFVLLFLLLGGTVYLVWKLHLRVENLAEKLSALVTKVKEGENVVIENFSIVEKRFSTLDHEIKSIETKFKESVKILTKSHREDRGRI